MAGKEKMTARAVAAAKPGRYCDGRGLWLVVSPSGARKWVFRFTCCGRVTEMGLGGHGTTLAEARKKADEARKIVAEGKNPIEAKREARMASVAKPTFGQCADALLQAKSSEWRNEKHRAQWQMTQAIARPAGGRS
jgi:Arm DNA-binding domain